MNQFKISTSGNDRIGQTETFATVIENQAPKGSVTLVLSTTYSKAKKPDSHQVKQTLYFASKNDLANYARWLLEQTTVEPKVTTLGEPFTEPFA